MQLRSRFLLFVMIILDENKTCNQDEASSLFLKIFLIIYFKTFFCNKLPAAKKIIASINCPVIFFVKIILYAA